MPCKHLPRALLQWAKSEGAVWQQLECECATNPAVLAVLYERQEAQLRQAQQQLQEQERLRAVDLQALNAARAQLHDTHQRHAQQLQQLQQQHMAELQQHDEQFAAALGEPAFKGVVQRFCCSLHCSTFFKHAAVKHLMPGGRHPDGCCITKHQRHCCCCV
jgi:hypothetical protein